MTWQSYFFGAPSRKVPPDCWRKTRIVGLAAPQLGAV